MANINYEAVLQACNPNTVVGIEQLDQSISEIREAVFPGCSHEDISISREHSESLATAVCNRLGSYFPTRIVIKRLLGMHK